MNKRKMAGECRLSSGAIIHPRRVRCRRERRDASRHPLMRCRASFPWRFFSLSLFFARFLAKKTLDTRARGSGIDILEVTRLPGLSAENNRVDKSKGINIRR